MMAGWMTGVPDFTNVKQLEEARAEIKRLTLRAETAEQHRKTMAAEIERLQTVIEFYADPQTYHAIMFMADKPCGEFIDDFSEDHGDDSYRRPMPGKRARAALE